MSDRSPPLRLLFVLGGRKVAERVDVKVLFREMLRARGLLVEYIILSKRPGPAWRTEIGDSERAHVVGCAGLAGVRGKLIDKWRELAADMRGVARVFTGDWHAVQVRDKFLVTPLYWLAAYARGLPRIYWLSYPFPEARLQEAREGRGVRRLFSLVWGRVSGWLLYGPICRGASLVFVQSEQMKSDLQAQGVPASKMTAVPMGIAPQHLSAPAASAVPGRVVYLGTLVRVRQLDILLEAMKLVLQEFPRAELIFIGDGDQPQDRLWLESQARELGIANAVRFTGHLPMEQAYQLVSTAAVCVSPFRPIGILRSTSPTKLVEYMAMGKPVVANDHPEQQQVLAESGAGVCVSWSAVGFASGILQLLRDPAAAQAMGSRGPEYVAQRRSYEVIARDVHERYLQLLGGSAAAQEPHVADTSGIRAEKAE